MAQEMETKLVEIEDRMMNRLHQIETSLTRNIRFPIRNNSTREDSIVSELKRTIFCKICQDVPTETLVCATCCGQLLGCGTCSQEHFRSNSRCPLCNSEEGIDKVITIRGMDQLLPLLGE